MKKINILKITVAFLIIWTLTACSKQQEEDRTVIKEPGKSITIIENEDSKSEQASITVEKIDKFDGMEITDWLDEQTVVLAKENPEFEKMSLLENSEYYPRSIYLYNFETQEYKPLKAPKDMFLGGAILSPDKNHLLYYEYSIGDTPFYIMSMDESDLNNITNEVLGLAMSAKWTDDNNVIGVSYAGGAYTADTSLNLTQINELQEEQLYTVYKTQNKIYYVTISDTLDMYILDLDTNVKKKLKIENVDGIIPSPDGKQILITQSAQSARKLLVADDEGNILRTIAEGTEINGVSWSPDQMMIAYQLRTVINGVDSRGLYIYDVLCGNSTQIAVNTTVSGISWSPSANKIAVTEYNERNYNSSIIYLGEIDSNTRKDMGYITAIDTVKKIISIDLVELLFSTDEERLAELGMTSEDLLTGFYIHNEDDNIEHLTYEDNISIELLDGALQLESSLEDLEGVLTNHKILANLTLIDNIVVRIWEQYIP